jgi:hypothetical protein
MAMVDTLLCVVTRCHVQSRASRVNLAYMSVIAHHVAVQHIQRGATLAYRASSLEELTTDLRRPQANRRSF